MDFFYIFGSNKKLSTMSRTKKIHPKVKKKDLEQLSMRITSLCINWNLNNNPSNRQAEKLSDEVRNLILEQQFRKRTYRIIQDEEQEEIGQ